MQVGCCAYITCTNFPYGMVNLLVRAPPFYKRGLATRMEGSFIHIPWRPFRVAIFFWPVAFGVGGVSNICRPEALSR